MSRFDRDELFSGRRERNWGVETERTREVETESILIMQRKQMEEQDNQLDVLGASIVRTKEIALEINKEANEHIRLLDDLDDKVSRTDKRVSRATNAVNKVLEKSSTGCLWGVICVLFLAFLVLTFLAFYF